MKLSVYWFRRDLRLTDNRALSAALDSGQPVLPLFIFDKNIIAELPQDDARVNFIHDQLMQINAYLNQQKSAVWIIHDDPVRAWKRIMKEHDISDVFFNRDYEPYARERDGKVAELMKQHGIGVHAFSDQVIFEAGDVLKKDGTPYTVFTPYKRRWLEQYTPEMSEAAKPLTKGSFHHFSFHFPSLEELGFRKSATRVKDYDLSQLETYPETRNLPAKDTTTHLGPHLRFGTVSIREIIRQLKPSDEVFFSELIWREFFMQILLHNPEVVDRNFNRKYDHIQWRNDEHDFDRWCRGETGYPMVDAGMRQLNETGFMHNRVRMVTASFLCKHLLIDWRWGEAYFALKLLDYELSSNNGNWQWAAGTGCDAAPYFRVFNPSGQMRKFDPGEKYVRKWVPEYATRGYPQPMVEHREARERAIDTYREGLKK